MGSRIKAGPKWPYSENAFNLRKYGRHRVKMYNIFFYTFTLMEDELNALLLCLQCHLWYLIAHSNNSKCIKFLCLHTLKAEELLESATLINFDRTTDH